MTRLISEYLLHWSQSPRLVRHECWSCSNTAVCTHRSGQDPFSGRSLEGQSIYLIQGELEIIYEDGNRVVMRAHSEWSTPVTNIRSANALTDIQLLHVEDSLLDKMVTWDQVSLHNDTHASSAKESSESPVRRLLNQAC